jgi:transaldolase
MNGNPLTRLEAMGQSIWMDFIRRGVLTSGQLKRWIDEDGISGVTSNPTIFEKAIAESDDYTQSIADLNKQGKTPQEIYEALTIEDIQQTADLFRPLYEKAGGADGYVSLEVSPLLARDTAGSIAEARRLWSKVNRPNVMIKIPGTREGLPAIRQLISEGINVNITLLFGLPRYQQVIDAYYSGLEDRADQGKSLRGIASVASFFLSRIDVLVDPQLEAMMSGADAQKAELARSLHGQMAIASAKGAYELFQRSISGKRFAALAARGARFQRVLWASTSTKNPAYSDVKYVEALIGPDTINTLPVETIDAYRDHGDPAPRLAEGMPEARDLLGSLIRVGIYIDQVTQQLEDEGVEKFSKSYGQLLDRLAEKEKQIGD